jgi:hypothetical protein
MQQAHFDPLLHVHANSSGRRDALRSIATIAMALLAALGPADPAGARKKRKRKKPKQQQEQPCAPCQERSNGRCAGVILDGTRCRDSGRCFAGVCAGSKIACGACQRCDGAGFCRMAEDDAPCGMNGKCLNGTCNERPTCERAGAPCQPDALPCCSGICQLIVLDARFCLPGASGASCLSSEDCVEGLACAGYRCS